MSKLAQPLGSLKVQNARARDKPHTLSDGNGLFLLVDPNGAKYWRMRYRFAGRERILAFGKYLDLSLSGVGTVAARRKLTR